MKARHQKILNDIFAKLVKANIIWSNVEHLLIALSADITEGAGSRVRVYLNGVRAVFHRPHPKKETDRGAMVSFKRFLIAAGVRL